MQYKEKRNNPKKLSNRECDRMREKSNPTNKTPALHDKESQAEKSITTKTQNSNKVSQVGQRLVLADEKITQLKKRREKLQAQQALLFLKESQKIFNTEFSTDLALKLLKKAWDNSPEGKKKQEQKGLKSEKEEQPNSAHSFRDSPASNPQQESPAPQQTHPPC